MIGQAQLIDAVTGHVERTAVDSADALDELFTQLGVDGDELRAALLALWDQRSMDKLAESVEPRTLYLAAAIDGFIVGLLASRCEQQTTASLQ